MLTSLWPRSLVLPLCLAAALVAPPASAEDPTEWSVQKFRPTIHGWGGFTTESARVSHNLTINAYLMTSLAGGDLLHDKNGNKVVDLLGSTDLVASIAFLDHLSFGLDVPFHYGTGTFLDGKALSPLTFGDVRLSLKATAFKPKRLGVGLGLAFDVLLPSGGRGGYGHEWDVVIVPKLVLDALTEHIHIMANLWAFARSGEIVPDATHIPFPDELALGSEMGANVALAVFLGSTDFRMIIEGRFESRLTRFFEPENTQLEFSWGLHWKHNSGFAVGGGASFGALPGYGDPDWRAFVTLGYQPMTLIPMVPPDRDGDGIPDEQDKCPDEPEDLDGFQDGDGCPDRDNDGDGIPDADDKCPNEPETVNGFADEDGCPDDTKDTDGDGLLDHLDRCPNEAEDFDGFQDDDGCPDPDNDGDGIPDAIDKCPNEPETYNGFKDEDGCPDTIDDRDGDGIPDHRDKCPDEPEDFDGFQDEDGCPDPDNDKDGILDGVDKCPLEPETFNGCNDDDGCPDDAKICVTKEKITIQDKIFFKTGKADILPKSYPLLESLAKVINDNPQIELLEIQGHTDNQGRADFNLTLSQDRAASVMNHLITIGQVSPARLTAKGFGPDAPIASNKTAKGRELNRRVEFMILRQKLD